MASLPSKPQQSYSHDSSPSQYEYRRDSSSAAATTSSFPLNNTSSFIGSPGPATTNPYTTVVQRAESATMNPSYSHNPPITVPVAPGSRSQSNPPTGQHQAGYHQTYSSAPAVAAAYAPAPVPMPADPYQSSYYSAPPPSSQYQQQQPPPPFEDPYYAQQQQQQYQSYPAATYTPDPYYQQQHQPLPATLPQALPSRTPSTSAADAGGSSRVYKVVPESESTSAPGMPAYTASNAPFAHVGASAGNDTRAGQSSTAGYGTGMLGATPYVKEKRKHPLTLCCFGRGFGGCCCCILLVLILLIAALLVFLFLIVKVPKVSFSGARAPADRSPLQLSGSTVNLNWDFVFQVSNPNSFGASVSSLDMRAFPPNAASNIDNQIANGTKLDTYIEANGNTNVQFPVTFSLSTKQSSNSQFFAGLISACGGGGAAGAGNQISVKYELDIGLAMLKPIGYKYKHEDKASFACPINIGGNPALSAILQLIGGLANNAARAPGAGALTSRSVLDKREPAAQEHSVELIMPDGSSRGRKVGRAWLSVGPN